jgi:TAT (twin-arginine translocation) pathway signal sequence
MIVSRRSVLKAGAAASAAITLPAFAASNGPPMILFDSRIPESRAFARAASGKMIDVADIETSQWTALRAEFAGKHHVIGLTGWTDWVTARGFLEERGLRLTSETWVPAPVSGKAHLFRWEMAKV